MLIPLMQRIGNQKAILAVVGDGPYREELQENIPNAIFTGYLHGEELAAAYASADVFVFPSTTDTYGNVVMEALASGIPCVVSDAGGPRGLVEHGKTGFVTRARDSVDFCAKTTLLVEDPQLRKTLVQNVYAKGLMGDWSGAARLFFGENIAPQKG
jgi:glycosyltransferase involved in cell wall biosynthesis